VIETNDGLCPEQILSGVMRPDGGWLADRWGRLHPLTASTTVGRRGDVSIHAASVSREHAELNKGDSWRLIDLASRNGTFVNEEPVSAPRSIVQGDHIRFGAVSFRFVEGSPDADVVRRVEMQTQSLEGSLLGVSLDQTDNSRFSTTIRQRLAGCF